MEDKLLQMKKEKQNHEDELRKKADNRIKTEEELRRLKIDRERNDADKVKRMKSRKSRLMLTVSLIFITVME